MIDTTVGTLLDLADRSLLDEKKPSIIERLSAIGKEVPLAADRWRISILLKLISEPLNIALKERQGLYEKYGKLENNRWMLEKDKLPEYNKELLKLRGEKVELNIAPLRIELFDNSEFTVKDLLVMFEGGIVSPPGEIKGLELVK